MANEIIRDAGIVTAIGDTNTVVISGDTYTGMPYAQGAIKQAIAEKQIVAAQDATLSGFTITSGKKFVGDTVTISGNTTRDRGTIYNNGGTVALIDSVFSGNKGKFGAAIDNYRSSDEQTSASLTVTGSTFTGNESERVGGVIVNRSFCTAVI
ncbi:MAG: hypothetical protein MJ016_02915, partial [Victivallaceae bacterium]|nr:hypothetical protein [Victivallaceae bacterium]